MAWADRLTAKATGKTAHEQVTIHAYEARRIAELLRWAVALREAVDAADLNHDPYTCPRGQMMDAKTCECGLTALYAALVLPL